MSGVSTICRIASTQSEYNGQVLSSLQLLTPPEDGLISSHHIVQSACQYLLTGRSLAEICEHNAAVAKQLSRHQVRPGERKERKSACVFFQLTRQQGSLTIRSSLYPSSAEHRHLKDISLYLISSFCFWY